jgi:DNA recombination protein RmuC
MSGIVLGWLVFRLITGRSAFSEENYNKMNSELIAAKTRLGEKEKDIEQLNSFLATERGNSTRLEKEVSSRETEIINLNLSLEDKRNELEKLNERFNEEFKNIANQILAHNSSEFSKNTVETLKNVLSPLKEQIDKFGNKIEETRINQVQEATSLKEQINQLTSLNQLMSAEAQNLTNALKGESKTRGTCGEMILEKILENSGLIKGEHFLAQTQYR